MAVELNYPDMDSERIPKLEFEEDLKKNIQLISPNYLHDISTSQSEPSKRPSASEMLIPDVMDLDWKRTIIEMIKRQEYLYDFTQRAVIAKALNEERSFEIGFINCKLCGKWTKHSIGHLRNHATVYHLWPQIYSCSICSFKGDYRRIGDHVKKEHANNLQDKIIPPRNEDPGTIARLQTLCFPPDSAFIKKFNSNIKICNICEVFVPSDMTLKHVAARHQLEPLYFCRHCNFSSYRRQTLMAHVARRSLRKTHPQIRGSVISTLQLNKGRLEKLADACFGDDGTSNIPTFPTSFRPRKLASGRNLDEPKCEATKKAEEDASCVETQSDDSGKAVECRMCSSIIQKNNTYNHVVIQHLNQPLLKCPICGHTEKLQRRNLLIHIQRTHPNAREGPIDLRNQFRSQIHSLRQRCFGRKQRTRNIMDKISS